MILHFSGTGNSRRAARVLAEELGDNLFSINDMLKARGALPSDAERYVFCAPTYAWRLPRLVLRAIERARFSGQDAWFILTCGANSGAAGLYAKALCRRVGLRFKGLAEVRMRENYIAMFSVPDAGESERLALAADARVRELALQIERGEDFRCADSPKRRILSAFNNPIFYKFLVSDRKFFTTGDCAGCGKCAALCPLDNIAIKNGRPVWSGNCTHCMACISACPAKAIEYGGSTRGKPRIYLP